MERPNNLVYLKDEAVKSGLNLDVVYEIENYILNKLCWKLPLETPQVLAYVLLTVASVQIDEGVCKALASEFDMTLQYIQLHYHVYRQFNLFIWTLSILQFILLQNKLENESQTLNLIIEAIMRDAQCNDAPDLIECFDLLTDLYDIYSNEILT